MRSSQKPWTVELATDYGVVGQVAACHNAVRPRSIRLNRHKTHPEPQQDLDRIYSCEDSEGNYETYMFRVPPWSIIQRTNSWDESRIIKKLVSKNCTILIHSLWHYPSLIFILGSWLTMDQSRILNTSWSFFFLVSSFIILFHLKNKIPLQ